MTAAFIVFIATFFLDFGWAFYTRAVADNQIWKASASASMIILLAGSATIAYTNEPWLLFPAAVGAFLGTVAAMKLKL